MIKKTKGTTIIELVIYMGLLTIFMSLLMSLLTATLNFKTKSESISAVQQDARFILLRLSYDVYNADSVIVPASLGNPEDSLSMVSSGSGVTFAVDANDDLIQTIDGMATKLNGSDTKVTEFSVESLGVLGEDPTIKVNLTIEGRTTILGNRVETETIETTLGLR